MKKNGKVVSAVRAARGVYGTAAFGAVCVFLAASWLAALTPLIAAVLGVVSAIVLVPAVFVAEYIRLAEEGNGVKLSKIAVWFTIGALVTAPALRLSSQVGAVGSVAALTAASVAGFYLFVAPVEEALKISATYIVGSDTRRNPGPVGYAVIGAFVGLGFGYAENAVHLVTGGLLAGGLAEVIVSRTVVGPVHVLLSAVAGYYIGKAKKHGSITEGVRGFVLVTFLHGTYNSLVVWFNSYEGAGGRMVILAFFGVLAWVTVTKIEGVTTTEALGAAKSELLGR